MNEVNLSDEELIDLIRKRCESLMGSWADLDAYLRLKEVMSAASVLMQRVETRLVDRYSKMKCHVCPTNK